MSEQRRAVITIPAKASRKLRLNIQEIVEENRSRGDDGAMLSYCLKMVNTVTRLQGSEMFEGRMFRLLQSDPELRAIFAPLLDVRAAAIKSDVGAKADKPPFITAKRFNKRYVAEMDEAFLRIGASATTKKELWQKLGDEFKCSADLAKKVITRSGGYSEFPSAILKAAS